MPTLDDSNDGLQKAFWRVESPLHEVVFEEPWPTETRGNGRVAENNARTGAAQGKSSLIRKARCRLCGFPNDLTRVDHSGGSIDGLGAGGQVSLLTGSAPTSAPASVTGQTYTHTESYGQQAYRNAAGCALCFSKDSSKIRTDVTAVNAYERVQPLGF